MNQIDMQPLQRLYLHVQISSPEESPQPAKSPDLHGACGQTCCKCRSLVGLVSLQSIVNDSLQQPLVKNESFWTECSFHQKQQPTCCDMVWVIGVLWQLWILTSGCVCLSFMHPESQRCISNSMAMLMFSPGKGSL